MEEDSDRPLFFSQIPLVSIDELIEEKILNFNLNYVSSKRKDDLFKKYKQQQEESLIHRKRQL